MTPPESSAVVEEEDRHHHPHHHHRHHRRRLLQVAPDACLAALELFSPCLLSSVATPVRPASSPSTRGRAVSVHLGVSRLVGQHSARCAHQASSKALPGSPAVTQRGRGNTHTLCRATPVNWLVTRDPSIPAGGKLDVARALQADSPRPAAPPNAPHALRVGSRPALGLARVHVAAAELSPIEPGLLCALAALRPSQQCLVLEGAATAPLARPLDIVAWENKRKNKRKRRRRWRLWRRETCPNPCASLLL